MHQRPTGVLILNVKSQTNGVICLENIGSRWTLGMPFFSKSFSYFFVD